MNKQQILERIRKIKALADAGVEGERDNAQRLLDELMQRFGITEEDLASESEELHFFTVGDPSTKSYDWKLLLQLSALIDPDFKIMPIDREIRKLLRHRPESNLCNIVMTCTRAQFVELTAKYIIYRKGWEENLDTFFYAFLKRNNLLVQAKTNEKPTPQELQRATRAASMQQGITKTDYLKQIETHN